MSTKNKLKIPKVNFAQLLEKFPEVDLPVDLTDETLQEFSRNNDPLPKIMIEQFLVNEQEAIDEFTEYLACFRIPATYDFHAIVYWKASLMTYEYVLASFSKAGELLQKQVIAGTKVESGMLVKSVATIEDDWIINVVGGITNLQDSNNYDASSSQSLALELLATGEIISLGKTDFNE